MLRALNLSIAVLLVIVLAGVYWYAWRPLPETSGTLGAPVSGEARISRDARGVPHIQAASVDDALFLEGYVMAQDRLWQMDALRRRAAGALAELVGPAALPSDQEARRLGLERIAIAQNRAARPEERAAMAAFARGVNFFIGTHRGRLPLEFTLLNYDPRPWTAADCWLAGLEMYRTLTSSWRAELMKSTMLAAGDRSKVDFLLPASGGSDPQPGSNAWAIGGSHTASGKPILANDPHLEFSIPSPWYLVALEAPGLNVTGAAIIGLPGVIEGHNENIAWGSTNLEFDVEDLYRERIDLRTGKYQAGEKVEQAQPVRDAILVKGGRTAILNNWVTRHGPLFASDGQNQYSVRWTAVEPGGLTFPYLEINRARNWSEFRAALERYAGPGQNFVYADTSGNIGYQVAGHLPIRKSCTGDAPSDGTGQECEWAGMIPFEQLPQVYNPESGVVVSANQSQFPPDFPYRVSGNFASPYRTKQIRARLGAREKWTAEDMLGVETDVYSEFEHFLAQQIVAAYDAKKPQSEELKDAVDTLRLWNGRMEKGAAAPMLVSLVYDQLRNLAGERAAAGTGPAYQARNAPRVIERLLRERPADWFPDYNALLVRALTGAYETGKKLQGSKASRWDYGQYRALRIDNPVEGRLPLIGPYFNIGPVPMSGSPTTILQHTAGLGPSLRMIVDLGNLEHSFANLTTGESGQRLSAHYKDQWDAYYAGRSFVMPFASAAVNQAAKDVLTVKPR